MDDQAGNDDPLSDPQRDPLYRAILGVLVASVLAGALLTLGGELVLESPALSNVGLGMAVIAGGAYGVLRLLARRRARAQDQRVRDDRPRATRQGEGEEG